QPAPAGAVVADPMVPLVVEERAVVSPRAVRRACGRGRALVEELAQPVELRPGQLAREFGDWNPAPARLSPSLSDSRSGLDQAAELLGAERVAPRGVLLAIGRELERDGLRRRR